MTCSGTPQLRRHRRPSAGQAFVLPGAEALGNLAVTLEAGGARRPPVSGPGLGRYNIMMGNGGHVNGVGGRGTPTRTCYRACACT